jgi:hypothetical protein
MHYGRGDVTTRYNTQYVYSIDYGRGDVTTRYNTVYTRWTGSKRSWL